MALTAVTDGDTSSQDDLNQYRDHLQGAVGSTEAYHLRISNGEVMQVTLADSGGTSEVRINDSGGNRVAGIDSDGNIDAAGTLTLQDFHITRALFSPAAPTSRQILALLSPAFAAVTADETLIPMGWATNINESGATVETTIGNHRAVSLTTGATADAYIELRSQVTAVTMSLEPYFAALIAASAANAALKVQQWGFRSDANPSATGTSVVGFRSVTTGNLFAVTRASGAETATDLGAPSTSGKVYEVNVTADGASAQFLIDGVVVATHTTNMPSASSVLRYHVGLENNTTTERTMAVRGAYVEQNWS